MSARIHEFMNHRWAMILERVVSCNNEDGDHEFIGSMTIGNRAIGPIGPIGYGLVWFGLMMESRSQ